MRLCGEGRDLVGFWNEVSGVLEGVLPHYMGACWFTLDPASLLITSHYNRAMPELPPDALALEYYEDDAITLSDVARSERGIATLHEATNGDPSGSPRWRSNITYGGDQEMVAALRARDGHVWGALTLYREPGEPMFDEEDKALMLTIAPHLAEAARRALLVGEAQDPDVLDPPGLVVLREDWTVESVTPGVERWLADLPGGDWDRGQLPSSLQAVAGRAMRTATHVDDPGQLAVSRVLSRSGTWVVLHGAALASSDARRVAVIVEPAHPARITSLLMSVYRLTDREKDVTRLVLQGNSTGEIAAQLFVSPHTVQQHLKSIFDKTGVRSRRDLVGKIFFSHYEPRLRDNERRAAVGRPLRGGPVTATTEGECLATGWPPIRRES